MSNLVPNMNQALEAQPIGGRVVSRQTRKSLQRTGEQALKHSAEVMATEFVANVAMGSIARVTSDEIHYSRELPDYAYRFRRIGDIQAMAAARKVQEVS